MAGGNIREPLASGYGENLEKRVEEGREFSGRRVVAAATVAGVFPEEEFA